MNTEKIPVAVLGATGSVGQKFIQLLSSHPWFEITEVAASEKSAGKKYTEAVSWFMPVPIPDEVANLTVKECKPGMDSRLVFSGLDSSIAGEVESEFAGAGYAVVSNSKNHRMDEDVPLLVPEINSSHVALIKNQKYGKGFIVTNPNCSTIGLALALKPLHDKFGIAQVNVVTMQAVSGAGQLGKSGLDIEDNVIPYIQGEEKKIEIEPLKILGELSQGIVKPAELTISAQCNRVNVSDGHLECVQVKLNKKTTQDEIIAAWDKFSAEPQKLKLPSAPEKPIIYFSEVSYPQPKLHREIGGGMSVSIGKLAEDKFFDYKFVVLSHNTIRGAAGGAILCAELLKVKSYI